MLKEDSGITFRNSSMEAPTTEALVTRLRSKASNDIFVDDDHNLLNFNIVESEIVW
jgi:hypothetical protein